MRLLLSILIFSGLYAKAITKPTQLLRACIDNDKMVVTVSWKTPVDLCNSFTAYRLYGSEDNGPFQLLATIPNINISEYPHSLASINTNWRYFLVTLNTCDGTDSTTSDTLNIDVEYPQNIELDSVSYDFDTQNIVAGWTSNSSPDTDGYQIYNFSSGDGDSIGYTHNTSYTITTNPLNRFPVVLATLDSCSLSSLLSKPHLPSLLNSTIDTCLNEIRLNWTLYSGWDKIDSQLVFYSINRSQHTRLTKLNPSVTSLVFNNFTLGDSIDFYVRTYSGNKTSSSNRSAIQTRKFVIPDYVYLDYVSVNQSQINLKWQTHPSTDVARYEIKKSVDGIAFNVANEVLYPTTTFTDILVDVHNQSYSYQIVAKDKCGDRLDSSQISNSILLTLEPTLQHNPYASWENGVNYYELEHNKDGSTWNVLNTSTSVFTEVEELETGCYRVKSTENINSRLEENVSYSNIDCKKDSLKVFVTESINPNTSNNRFAIYGSGIDHSKSVYGIYNRWGEQLVQNKTDEVWNLNYNGKQVQSGVYLYVVTVIGQLGEKKTIKGTLHVLR